MAPPSQALEAGVAPGLTLDALRARGAQRVDPLRFAFIEALARRSSAHQGAARQLLDAKLAQALADCAARCEQTHAQAGEGKSIAAKRAQPGPLAELVRQLDLPASALAGAAPAQAAGPAGDPPPELKALQQHRRTWARLSVDRQLSRSLAQLPQNPGPLNSHLLALRSLRWMQDTAPAYLQGFVAQVEALLWLDAASHSAALVPGKAVRRDSDKKRKSGSGRAGR